LYTSVVRKGLGFNPTPPQLDMCMIPLHHICEYDLISLKENRFYFHR
jgi:hypothetical protein